MVQVDAVKDCGKEWPIGVINCNDNNPQDSIVNFAHTNFWMGPDFAVEDGKNYIVDAEYIIFDSDYRKDWVCRANLLLVCNTWVGPSTQPDVYMYGRGGYPGGDEIGAQRLVYNSGNAKYPFIISVRYNWASRISGVITKFSGSVREVPFEYQPFRK